MAITTLSMVLTVFVLNLHHVTDRPVPNWAKKVILVYLARLLCMCAYESKLDKEKAEKEKAKYRITPNNLGKAIGNQIGLIASLNGTLGVSSSSTRDSRSRDRYQSNAGLFADRHSQHYRSQYTYGSDTKPKEDPKKLEEEWGKEWRRLAEVVDRLFFWIFLSAIVITTLLLFHPLTKAYFSLLGDETFLGDKEATPAPNT